MIPARWRQVGLVLLLSAYSTCCVAHSFGTPYVPPLPLWMYVYGCAATLVITFALLGFLVTSHGPGSSIDTAAPGAQRAVLNASARYLDVMRAGTVALFVLTIIAGLVGSQAPDQNITTVVFWVLFLLVFAYATALIGNLFPLINPWAVMVDGLERLGFDLSKRRIRYHARLAHWPALFLYVTLIWIELFLPALPRTVSFILLGYTALTLAGAAIFGRSVWFSQADFFGVYFKLIGKLAPIEHERRDHDTWTLRLRAPLAGTLLEQPRDFSVVLFVLFMLASTTYDSIHETALWAGLFWKNALILFQPLWGTDLAKAQDLLMDWYLFYRQAGLVIFPLLYLAIYLLFAGPTKLVLKQRSVSGTALAFCYTLLPIALAYHFTHYFPFLVSVVSNFSAVLSDPLALGWRLFPASVPATGARLPMGLIWHTQVLVLLLGHLAGIYLAHTTALRQVPEGGSPVLSQIPLLLLMVIYTVTGLWILSLPLAAE